MFAQVLLKELQAGAYSDGLRDQNAVIYLLKTHLEWQDRVMFQDKEICLNCYWHDLIGVTGYGKPSYDRVENVSSIRISICTLWTVLAADAALAAPLPTISKNQPVSFGHMRGPQVTPQQVSLRKLGMCSQLLGRIWKVKPGQGITALN